MRNGTFGLAGLSANSKAARGGPAMSASDTQKDKSVAERILADGYAVLEDHNSSRNTLAVLMAAIFWWGFLAVCAPILFFPFIDKLLPFFIFSSPLGILLIHKAVGEQERKEIGTRLVAIDLKRKELTIEQNMAAAGTAYSKRVPFSQLGMNREKCNANIEGTANYHYEIYVHVHMDLPERMRCSYLIDSRFESDDLQSAHIFAQLIKRTGIEAENDSRKVAA